MLCVMPYSNSEWFADIGRHIIARMKGLVGARECYMPTLTSYIASLCGLIKS